MVVSLQARQLARVARNLATEALTLELAAERGDWEVVHVQHDLLVALQAEYRMTYRRLLLSRAHRVPTAVRTNLT